MCGCYGVHSVMLMECKMFLETPVTGSFRYKNITLDTGYCERHIDICSVCGAGFVSLTRQKSHSEIRSVGP